MSFSNRLAVVCILTGLAAPLAVFSIRQEPAGSHPRTNRRDFLPGFVERPSIKPNPNPRVPLAALVEFVADRPVRATLAVSDGVKLRRASFDQVRRQHMLPVLRLSPGKRYSVSVTVTDIGGNSFTMPEPLEIQTEPLPRNFPPLRARISEPHNMEPGITLFNVARYESSSYGLLVAVDETGEVIWYFQADHPIGDVMQLRSGNVLYLRGSGAAEIDWLGNTLRQWHPTARAGLGPAGTIPVNADTFHHDICELPGGNFLLLSTELRRLDGYPSSEENPSAPPETANVVADVIAEMASDGQIVNQLSLFDLLDPYRIGYGSLGGIWNSLYKATGDSTRDWTHGNAVFHDPSDDSVLLSLRHQDAVVKISRQTGALQWILGNHGGWKPPWSRFLLEPVGKLQWPYHQHASIITPEGTILLFDNGNFRARPFETPMPPAQSYSRAVEYKVDEVQRTVTEVWSYGGTEDEVFYSPFGGSAYWLPITGNVLVTDSARITDADGIPTENVPGARRFARIVEVTHTRPARKVFELIVGDESSAAPFGWSVYRSRRLAAPHAPAFGAP